MMSVFDVTSGGYPSKLRKSPSVPIIDDCFVPTYPDNL